MRKIKMEEDLMRKRGTYLVVLGLLLVLFLTACGSKPTEEQSTGTDNNATSETREEGNQEATGKNEIVFVVASEAPSMDPIRSNDSAATDAQSQLMDGLTRFDPETSELVPYLATDFEQIEPTVWEFNLREGVYFTDGAPFDADVVALNLNRLLNIEEASPALFIVEMITEVEVVDTYTVRIHTAYPFAPLASHFAHRATFMVSPNAIEAAGVGEDVEPIGTGAFVLSEREHGNYMLMERNEEHWNDLAIPDAVRFIVVPDPVTRFAMIQTGEAHYAVGQASDYATASGIDSIDARLLPSTSLAYVGFNTTKGALADPLVRRAISHAIDRNAILEGIYEGVGSIATGPLSPLVDLAPTIEGLEYDVDLARELLEESGHTNIELEFWYNEGNSTRGLIGVYVQAALAEIGITVNVSSVEWGAYLEATAAGEHDMYILGWTTVTGDADYGLYSLFHSSQVGDPGNRFFFENAEVDALLESGRESADRTARAEVYQELAELLVNEAPMVELVFQDFVLLSNGVDNVYTNFNNVPFFYNATLRD